MARVIALCNQKGGVGKTTTVVNLAAYLAAAGRRVLVVDFDPQGNASSALGGGAATSMQSIYHGVLGLVHVRQVIRPSALLNLHYIPAAQHLAGLLVELVGLEGRERKLRNLLTTVRHEYDYVLIDLAPSVSLLTINGLIASDEVLIPVQAEYYSLEGLGQLLETVELIKTNMGHRIGVAGALLTMHDRRERLSRDVAKNLRRHFPHHVYEVEIPRSIALAEAPSFGKPVLLHQPDSSGARAYRMLAHEVIAQEHDRGVATNRLQSEQFGNFNIPLS